MRLLGAALALLLVHSGALEVNAARWELAFVAAERRVPQIFVVGADGTGRRRLTSTSGPSTTPVWSPDGQRIAFVRQTGDDAQIYTMNADGGSQRALTSRPGTAASPAWAPVLRAPRYRRHRRSSPTAPLRKSARAAWR